VEDTWNILVVDDEEDMHTVTRLALRKYQWRNRRFAITSAHSADRARSLLTDPEQPRFQVALVDVVMETDHAGLELCRFIRKELGRELRIVVRTGQAGIAPELEVLEQYDIDFYLSKIEATPERLFAVIRACVHCSEDIRALETP
jgi:CheY-like chemotaxis protein